MQRVEENGQASVNSRKSIKSKHTEFARYVCTVCVLIESKTLNYIKSLGSLYFPSSPCTARNCPALLFGS